MGAITKAKLGARGVVDIKLVWVLEDRFVPIGQLVGENHALTGLDHLENGAVALPSAQLCAT